MRHQRIRRRQLKRTRAEERNRPPALPPPGATGEEKRRKTEESEESAARIHLLLIEVFPLALSLCPTLRRSLSLLFISIASRVFLSFFASLRAAELFLTYLARAARGEKSSGRDFKLLSLGRNLSIVDSLRYVAYVGLRCRFFFPCSGFCRFLCSSARILLWDTIQYCSRSYRKSFVLCFYEAG